MARQYITLCFSCAEKLGELYELRETELHMGQKRVRCEMCRAGGCFSRYGYDPHAPKRGHNAETK